MLEEKNFVQEPSPFRVVSSVKKNAVSISELDCDLMEEMRQSWLNDCSNREMELIFPLKNEKNKWIKNGIFYIENVLCPEECKYLIQVTENAGYTFWDSRPEKITSFRNADTIEIFKEDLAKLLWNRIYRFIKNITIKKDDLNEEFWQCDLE